MLLGLGACDCRYKSIHFPGKLAGQDLRITIGDVKVWNLDDARAEARRLQT
jgi:hypothetical protein